MIISLMIFFTASLSMQAQNTKKTVEIKIKTSAQCGQCKDRIEKALAYEKGIKSSNLDLKTKIVTVVYFANKTTPEKIRTVLSKTGYDADDVAAVKAAYDKLPPCCKKPAPGQSSTDHSVH